MPTKKNHRPIDEEYPPKQRILRIGEDRRGHYYLLPTDEKHGVPLDEFTIDHRYTPASIYNMIDPFLETEITLHFTIRADHVELVYVDGKEDIVDADGPDVTRFLKG